MSSPTIQNRHPPNDAADFVANRVELLGVTEVQYNVEEDQMQVDARPSDHEALVEPDPWVDVLGERDKLLAVLEEFQSKQKIELGVEKINVRECSWREVMKLIRRAENQYKNEKLTGMVGHFRKCLRKLGENGEVFENWLRILPDGDYGSIISGSFHVIIKTASEMSKVRECVFQALEDIPDIIARAEVYIDIYKAHPARKLKQATAALFMAILSSLRLILEYFGRKSLVKSMKTLAQGSAYERSLVDSIENIRTLAKKIKEQASQCMQERLCGVDQTVVRVDRNVIRLDANVLSMIQSMDDLPQSLAQALTQALYRLLQSNPLVDRRTGQAYPFIGAPSTGEVNVKDGLRSSATSQHASLEHATSTPVIKPKRILKIMRYDQISPVIDIERCLELADDMEPIAIDRASWVMGAEEFHSWLGESKSSRSMLINGNSDPLENTSPLSLFCAHLTHLFVAVKPVIVVSYFCGLHAELATDPRANAQGMMISLIGQLLLQAGQKKLHFDMSFLAQKKLQLLAVDDLKTLCTIFQNLVIQLPKNRIIFVVIDGISLYEATDGDADLLYAWQKLNQLLTHKSLKAVMKLLATSPGQTLHLHEEDVMMNGDVLYMPEEVDGDRQGAWNSADFDDSINQSFSSEKV